MSLEVEILFGILGSSVRSSFWNMIFDVFFVDFIIVNFFKFL